MVPSFLRALHEPSFEKMIPEA
jgi:hypothetical protein